MIARETKKSKWYFGFLQKKISKPDPLSESPPSAPFAHAHTRPGRTGKEENKMYEYEEELTMKQKTWRRLAALLLVLGLCLVLSAQTLAEEDLRGATRLEMLQRTGCVGADESCALSAAEALAFADKLRAETMPVVKAALFNAGGQPMLWIARGQGWDLGNSAIQYEYDDSVYNLSGGKVTRSAWITALLRAGENGVVVQSQGAYYSDFAETFRLYHLSDGAIAGEPFAEGVFDPMNGSRLNGAPVDLPEWMKTDSAALYRMADPDLNVLLSASSGLADMLFLKGDWRDARQLEQTLREYAAARAQEIRVSVGGRMVSWSDAAPFIEGNRVMVPLSAVANALGLSVNWNAYTRTASFSDGGRTLTFSIGGTTAMDNNGGVIQMDTPAIIARNRTFAPIRYLAEFFGRQVSWDPATRTVSISG